LEDSWKITEKQQHLCLTPACKHSDLFGINDLHVYEVNLIPRPERASFLGVGQYFGAPMHRDIFSGNL
jgi:hypothetical protein